VIAVPGQSESQQGRADAVEHSGGNIRRYSYERQAEQRSGKRIELLRFRIGILVRKTILSSLNSPAEVARPLVKMSQQEPAEDSGGESDGCGDQNSQSHGEFDSHKL